ncbi:hypothetical protein [Undibacterium sp. Di24W]|uniref:hypothetical protein n=1 Tax=Undibacterium sp. Di24W TaxID=3413033 RepID=UPI003BEF8502
MRFLLYLFSLVFVNGLLTSDAEAQTASRNAGAGCTWKPYEFKELGVRLLFKDCKDPTAHYELHQEGDWIKMRRPSDPVTFGSQYLIRVLSKPADQSITESIQRQFVAQIVINDSTDKSKNQRDQIAARKECGVVAKVKWNDDPLLQRFEIIPKPGKYKRQIDRQLQKEPRDFGCGEYGAGQSTTYFEYHPQQSETKFIYVNFGWDEDALFDEKTIVFF